MKKVILSEKNPIKLWLDDIEDGAMEQAKNLANLPFVFKHVAIMPDAHQGYGMPIGGVLATRDVVIPNAVGVDIGCGIFAIRTSLTDIDTDTLKKLMGEIRKVIPVGFNHHKEMQSGIQMPDHDRDFFEDMPVLAREHIKARKSLGTLGGGNHFIEIQKDSDGLIWIMIHSGSRNLGKQVADYYNQEAIRLNSQYYSMVESKIDLAFLPIRSDEARFYMKEMNYCVNYAGLNRQLMMDRIWAILDNLFPGIMLRGEIRIAHNYVAWENHFGESVLVHRKGATSAREGQFGIIPGSQGTKSYIVKGLGNPHSFMSCSHGAGRRMGRKQAQRQLNLEAEKKILDDQGIIHGMRNASDLDEAPGAYKPIDQVMANQTDLVEIIYELSPLGIIKG